MREIHVISQRNNTNHGGTDMLAAADKRRILNRRKRARQLRARFMFVMFTGMITICCAILFSVMNSKARVSADNEEILYKYYKTVEIQPGDTLWELAEANYSEEKQTISEYIKEVKNINHISDEKLISGYYIVLPYYSAEFVCY